MIDRKDNSRAFGNSRLPYQGFSVVDLSSEQETNGQGFEFELDAAGIHIAYMEKEEEIAEQTSARFMDRLRAHEQMVQNTNGNK